VINFFVSYKNLILVFFFFNWSPPLQNPRDATGGVSGGGGGSDVEIFSIQ